ncbi:MAG: hypothetical protein AAF698_12120, partial [Pseudomonadota bacterium]
MTLATVMHPLRTALPFAAILALAACAEGGDETPAASTASDAPTAEATPATTEPAGRQYAPEDVPSIWMAIEGGPDRPTSVVFAIDGDLNGSVADNNAVRITPVPTAGGAGNCDIADLDSYSFSSTGPIFDYRQ